MSRKRGTLAEQQARAYLIAQGLRWIGSNYNCRMGEIDLIMQDQSHLVFVEVRSRISNAFGGALESIDYKKKQKIVKAASLFLLANHLYEKQPVRFDIVSLQGCPAVITWIKNVFDSDF